MCLEILPDIAWLGFADDLALQMTRFAGDLRDMLMSDARDCLHLGERHAREFGDDRFAKGSHGDCGHGSAGAEG
jgi:hypothetical protein